MTLSRGGTRSRLAALALAGLVAAVLWTLLVAPSLTARAELDADLDATRNVRARLYARTIAGSARGTRGAVLVAATPSTAAALLGGRVELAVEDAGAVVERLEAAPLPVRPGGSRLIPVRAGAAFTGTTAQLHQVLLALDSGQPAMIVDELSVTAAPQEAFGSRTNGGSAERLRIELGVRAFTAIREPGR